MGATPLPSVGVWSRQDRNWLAWEKGRISRGWRLKAEEPIVSIRPRAVTPGETRLLRLGRKAVTQFQSAPGCYTGGNFLLECAWSDSHCFNPPPAVTPGETGCLWRSAVRFDVSIRPRLLHRGKPMDRNAMIEALKVSI